MLVSISADHQNRHFTDHQQSEPFCQRTRGPWRSVSGERSCAWCGRKFSDAVLATAGPTSRSPHLLTRHDESPANISILDETFPVRHIEFLCRLQGRHTTRVGHRNDDVDFEANCLEFCASVVCQSVSHGHARAIDRDAVEDRVGSCKVDVLENIGRECSRGHALLDHDTVVAGDDDGLACKNARDVRPQAVFQTSTS